MTVALTFPYGGGASDTINLPEPLEGNSDLLNLKTKFLRSMNGINYAYKKTATVRTLHLSWRILTDAERASLKTFIENANNDELKLVWKTITWKVRMLNNPFELVQDRDESHSVTIQFEGAVQ